LKRLSISDIRELVNNDHPIDFLSPQDGEFMKSKATAQWYLPLQLASGEVEYVRKWFNLFNHLVRAWTVPLFERTGGK
jgi:hypothetical protein